MLFFFSFGGLTGVSLSFKMLVTVWANKSRWRRDEFFFNHQSENLDKIGDSER